MKNLLSTKELKKEIKEIREGGIIILILFVISLFFSVANIIPIEFPLYFGVILIMAMITLRYFSLKELILNFDYYKEIKTKLDKKNESRRKSK